MTNFSLQVLNPVGSYTRVFTVAKGLGYVISTVSLVTFS